MSLQRDLFTGDVIVNGKPKPVAPRVNGQAKLLLASEHTAEAIRELKAEVVGLQETVAELREIISRQQSPAKESYSTQEVAAILGRKPYTVREWCRLRRINAEKTMCGRGCEEEWRVSHEELRRIQNEGLLPRPDKY